MINDYNMENSKIALYMHGGSANHGCEAIVRSTCAMLPKKPVLLSTNPQEDEYYKLNNLCEIRREKSISDNKLMHIFLYFLKKVLRIRETYTAYQLKAIRGKKSCTVNMMIGGDNYCYLDMVEDMVNANKLLSKNGKTVLWGCSVEPDSLKNSELIEDMKRYSLITARESITYNALVDAGVTNNVYLLPDPAFTLRIGDVVLPDGLGDTDIVGINISPMIIDNETTLGMAERNYEVLIQYILDNTSWKIMLVPHVVRGKQDDREPIRRLYEKFRESGRVYQIDDNNCENLKGYISKCRFFLGARTHSTIAAYSTMVPTIVMGYSVKAIGIARDLFGTDENYVLPVQKLASDNELLKAFKWVESNEDSIRARYEEVMPSYIERASKAGELVKALMES